MRVTPSLDTLGSFLIANPPDPDLIQNDPALAFGDSCFLVAWADEKYGTPNLYRTTVARVTRSGAVLDTGVPVNPSPGAYEYRPSVGFDGERWLVVWTGSGSGIFGRFVNQQGQPEGDLVTFATGQGGGADLAFDGTNYLVTWFTGTYPELRLYARLISPAGVLVGPGIDIQPDSGCHRWADVAFDGTNYLVVWQTGDNDAGQDLWARFVDSDGRTGSLFRVSDQRTDRRWWPSLAASDRNFLVCWGQGSATDVWGNVDVETTGVSEGRPPELVVNQNRAATVGSLSVIQDQAALFDPLGRRVSRAASGPGVYFLVRGPGQPAKAILVR